MKRGYIKVAGSSGHVLERWTGVEHEDGDGVQTESRWTCMRKPYRARTVPR